MLLGQGPHFEKQDSKSFSKMFVLLQQEFEGRDPCAQHVPGTLEDPVLWPWIPWAGASGCVRWQGFVEDVERWHHKCN